MSHLFRLIILICICSSIQATQYYWPLYKEGGIVGKYISSTFAEYRWSSTPARRHFHEGCDIPAIGYDFYVCSTTDTFRCIDYYFRQNVGWFVIVQNYDYATSLDEGSRYLHMRDYNTNLERGKLYYDTYIAANIGFYDNHLHFELRTPVPEIADDKNSFNFLAIDSIDYMTLWPYPEDNYKPILETLYVDGDPGHQGNAEIECWNFLSYNFNRYYNTTQAPPFVALHLPIETPEDDLDDPHILIYGNRQARLQLLVPQQHSFL